MDWRISTVDTIFDPLRSPAIQANLNLILYFTFKLFIISAFHGWRRKVLLLRKNAILINVTVFLL